MARLGEYFHSIFKMCFHLQNVKGFVSVGFPFSEGQNCKQKFVNKNLYSHYTDEVVLNQRNIYKAFKFVFNCQESIIL